MSSSTEPLLVQTITHYRQAQVIVLAPATGPALVLRGEAAVAQFEELEKKLKSSAELTDPILIGDREFLLAPTLTIDAISGPVFWEEIAEIVKNQKATNQLSSRPTAQVG